MSRKPASLVVLLVLISCTALVVPTSAQHFQIVGGTLAGVSAGRNEVFGFDSNANVWRYHVSTGTFSKIANASLYTVQVGGGTLSQLDEVWGIQANFNVYRFNYSTNTFVQIPGAALDQITVGEGTQDTCHPYEVWGVGTAEAIFRYNYCTNEFVQVAGSLIQVVTGGGDVWGINMGLAISTSISPSSCSRQSPVP